MIQTYYKYRPASVGALALLVRADGKDRITQQYIADMLRVVAMRPGYTPVPLREILNAKPRKQMDAPKGERFVDDMISTFRKGGGR